MTITELKVDPVREKDCVWVMFNGRPNIAVNFIIYDRMTSGWLFRCGHTESFEL